MSTVAASVAVICAVALTNSMALSDTQGSTVHAARVVVPSSGGASAANGGEAPDDVAPVPPAAEETRTLPVTPVAEIVPAPDPVVIAPPVAQPVAEPHGGSPVIPSQAEAVAAAKASGSWDSAREWAATVGWSQARIDAWIAKLERTHGSVLDDWQGGDGSSELTTDSDSDRGDSDRGDSDRRSDRRDADRTRSGADHGQESVGTEQLAVEPAPAAPAAPTGTAEKPANAGNSPTQRPAHAGANAEHRSEKPGAGEKKDRSRVSPDRRDR
ncbi:hypothetical protein [Microbacterium sp. CFBP9034]|uniref:hypothetical protein n=1 Tax=Microbacterium sp. CFBP9034 TaxID=3096540 RepID=UPI002A6AE63E|nr:hypothetical protein [Microbacterium sp. CFBP9034]MDY0911073.1 hypothetical protein [Microbacterium sp. CFBP9034]